MVQVERGGVRQLHTCIIIIFEPFFVLHLFNVICTAKAAKLLQGKQGNGSQNS